MDAAVAGYFVKPVEIGMEERALSRKVFSYDRLIRPLEGEMTRLVWRIVRDREDAEDALQDALSTIWKKRRRVCVHPNPRALVLRICINAAYDALRKQHRRRKHEEPNSYEQNHAHIASSQTGALEKLVQKETEKEILAAIGRLPRRQAVAVLLRIVREQPYDMIARIMGCSEGTVRIHVARGRNRLSQWLAHLSPHPQKEVSK